MIRLTMEVENPWGAGIRMLGRSDSSIASVGGHGYANLEMSQI